MSFVRHYNGRNSGRISLQAKRGNIWAVEWTWRKHRICRTEREATEARRHWQAWKRRQGWTVAGNRATSPTGHQEVCEVTRYDPQTLARVYPEMKPKPARPAKPTKSTTRRGRKPVGV